MRWKTKAGWAGRDTLCVHASGLQCFTHTAISVKSVKNPIFFTKIPTPAKKPMWTQLWQKRALWTDLRVLDYAGRKKSFCQHTLPLQNTILLPQLNQHGYTSIAITATYVLHLVQWSREFNRHRRTSCRYHLKILSHCEYFFSTGQNSPITTSYL